MASHSSILAWENPWTMVPGRLQSMGPQESDRLEQLNHHHREVIPLLGPQHSGYQGVVCRCYQFILMAQRGKEEPVPQSPALIKESQHKNFGCIHSLSCDSHPHPLDL